MKHRWYYTAAAVKQWLAITNREDDDGGPNWGAAEQELCRMSHDAKVVEVKDSGAKLYRCKVIVNGRMKRVEMTVIDAPRPEGPLPQLVRVRAR